MIRSFTVFRFLFAVMIFLHHYIIDEKSVLEAGGAVGVAFFFMLSGFTLAYSYKDRIMEKKISYSYFILNRAMKIYPLHWILFFAVFLLGIRNFQFSQLPVAATNFLLLQSWVPFISVYFSYNAVSWFLSDQLFFYLLFPFLLPLVFSVSWRKILITGGAVLGLYLFLMFLIPMNYIHPIFYINPVFRLLDFVLGILLFRFYLWYRDRSLYPVRHIWIGILAVVGGIFLYGLIPEPYNVCGLFYWIPLGFLVIQLVDYKGIDVMGVSLFSNKWLLILGEASFSFYLIHPQVIFYTRGIAKRFLDVSTDNYVALVIILGITMLGSIVCMKLVERPIGNWLKSKLWKRAERSQSMTVQL